MTFGAASCDTRLYDAARREAHITMFEMPEEAFVSKDALIELMALSFRRGASWQLEQTQLAPEEAKA